MGWIVPGDDRTRTWFEGASHPHRAPQGRALTPEEVTRHAALVGRMKALYEALGSHPPGPSV